jgi:hypothetical protein
VRLRSVTVSACAAAATALCTGTALAAGAVAGATYRGTLSALPSKVPISFRVSPDGRQVVAIGLGQLPIYCGGSGPPAAKIAFRAAPISASGTFTAQGRDTIAVGPLKGTAVATLTLTGTFSAGRRESGVVSTHFAGSGSKCGGHSPYTTKA